MRGALWTIVTALAAALASATAAGPAHEHGVARLDIVVDPARVSLQLQTPLDNLVGFERAPRSDAERDAVAVALARLRDAARLFRIDGRAQCQTGRVEVSAATLGLPTPAASPVGGHANGRDSHAELDAFYEFRCAAGGQAGFVEVGLFDLFPRLQRIELQIVTPRGQLKATLRRPNGRVALAR